ncbi:helix-turn-helix transcriptional regulator [Mesorhizobium sp. M0140]|uniref:helix-turn-helix transcriptional regulator n=1 Tax=Mesorhizobium sp. M0140 TaxID=2956893 RepID=UPI00333CD224
MTGPEMKDLRQRAKLSQAQLASAIGMSRESIGRIERSRETVEKRTELAVRYIAEYGIAADRSLSQVHSDVANVLDDAAVRASPSIQRTDKLKAALESWTAAGGSDTGRQLIYRAQGVIGQINVSDARDPTFARTMSDLTQVKLEWAALKA